MLLEKTIFKVGISSCNYLRIIEKFLYVILLEKTTFKAVNTSSNYLRIIDKFSDILSRKLPLNGTKNNCKNDGIDHGSWRYLLPIERLLI